MDFTNIKCISESCKNKNIAMRGHGGHFGGRIMISKVKCPECGLLLMIVPMEEKYEYGVSATTAEERKNAAIEKAKAESELALAKIITELKETEF